MHFQLYHSERNNVIQDENEVQMTKEIVNVFQTGVLKHNFKFKSAYHFNNENYVSTYQDEWVLVDYIFFSDESKHRTSNIELKLMNFLSLPTRDECDKVKLRIPNQNAGSDHLFLAAQFKLCHNEDKRSRNELVSTKL